MSGAFTGQVSTGQVGISRYQQAFAGVNTVTILHNLGYQPTIMVLDSLGGALGGQVTHLDLNSFNVAFNLPLAGVILYY